MLEDRRLYCRNCNEDAPHVYIGHNKAPAGLFRKGEPVWACRYCGCRRLVGPGYGPGMDCSVPSDGRAAPES